MCVRERVRERVRALVERRASAVSDACTVQEPSRTLWPNRQHVSLLRFPRSVSITVLRMLFSDLVTELPS